jgi:hypothetical protein
MSSINQAEWTYGSTRSIVPLYQSSGASECSDTESMSAEFGLPLFLKRKKALVSRVNKKHSFLWCVVLHNLIREQQRKRTYNYISPRIFHPYVRDHFPGVFQKFTFPMKLVDIPKFEAKYGLRINVIGYNREIKDFFLHHQSAEFRRDVIHLFYVRDGMYGRFYYVKNLAKLLSTPERRGAEYCPYCLMSFNFEEDEEELEMHKELCH